jgi:hypothetical protein
MKNLKNIISLLSSVYSFGQCVNLYVKEHLDGDPICRLSPGSTLEICLDTKTISGGACTFYIQSSRMNGDVQTYEFGLDKTTMYFYAPKYGDLIINTKTKKFGFVIDNNSGAYSYYNEAEMQKIREEPIRQFGDKKNTDERVNTGNEQRNKIENQKKEEELIQKKKMDEKDLLIKIEVENAIEKKEYFRAVSLYEKLNKSNIDLLAKINSYYNPIKKEMDLLYSQYQKEFIIKRTDYINDSNNFIKANQQNIYETTQVIDGKDAYLDRIKNSSSNSIKNLRSDLLKRSSCLYEKKDGKHYISAIGILPNYYDYFDSQVTDEIKLKFEYDTICKRYFVRIDLYLAGTFRNALIIINKSEYLLKHYEMPFSSKLESLIQEAENQGYYKLSKDIYTKMKIPLDKMENIPFKQLKSISKPKEGLKNDDFETMKKKFNDDFKKYIYKDFEIVTNNFYNPSILYLIKKIYPNSDSLIFAFGDYQESLGKSAIHIPINIDGEIKPFGSIIPLQKGGIELKKDNLFIYKDSENYSELKLNNRLEQSLISLSNIKLDEINIDSSFLTTSNDKSLITQSPLNYLQLQIGIMKQGDNLRSFDYLSFYYSDSVFIQTLPVYNTQDIYANSSKPSSYISGRENLCFNFERKFKTYQDMAKDDLLSYWNERLPQKDLQNYLININKYFVQKKLGELKKANKYRIQADKYLDKYKTTYFNLKRYY